MLHAVCSEKKPTRDRDQEREKGVCFKIPPKVSTGRACVSVFSQHRHIISMYMPKYPFWKATKLPVTQNCSLTI